MGNSKIVYYGETLMDLTGDTVEAGKLLKGITAHDKAGEKITGTYEAADPYAVIGVTYPAGSICTCTNGSKTLTAKDTSGTALFVIPEAGTWTVKAVSGDKSASKAVSITAEGQVETVKLTYELVLFDINGWLSKYSTPEMSEMSFESGEGLVAQYHEWGNILCSTVKISEIVDYAELCFDYSITYIYGNHPTFGLNKTSTLSGYGADVAETIVENDGDGTAVVDISSIKRPYYLRISGNFTGIISKIYLR